MKHKHKTPLLTREQALSSRKWYIFDAAGQTLGRFSSMISNVLRGKHRADFTPHVDCGDGVVIINAEKIKVTGMKGARKIYKEYTGFVGGLREIPYNTLMARKPTYILRHAIKGMMPKTRLGDQQLKKLRIYAGDNHSMQAQNPTPIEL